MDVQIQHSLTMIQQLFVMMVLVKEEQATKLEI